MAAPFQTRFRTLEDVKQFLSDNYAPSCILPEETPEEAHRRAGGVELAQRIIATIEREDEPDLGSLIED